MSKDQAAGTQGQGSGQSAGQSGGAGNGGDAVPQYEVVVNGETVKVGLPDLLAGYQRQSDYTRKTQALSAKEREMERLVEEKATELYLKALKEGKGGEGNGAGDEGGEGEIPESIKKELATLKEQVTKSQASLEQKESDRELQSIMAELKKEFPDADTDKVMIRFYNEADDNGDVKEQFRAIAAEEQKRFLKMKQDIIDGYVKEKQKNPFSAGESGHSAGMGGGKLAEPPKTFEDARERAEARLAASRGA